MRKWRKKSDRTKGSKRREEREKKDDEQKEG